MLLVPYLAQPAAGLVDKSELSDGDKRRDARRMAFAETIDDMLKYRRAVGFNDVYVNISDLLAVFITKAGEDSVPRFRIQVDDACDVGDAGAADRTSRRADGVAMLSTPADKFRHGEHEAVHAQLAEDAHFLVNSFAESLLL